MPCLELSLPAVTDEVRAQLARSLTSAFAESTGHAAEIFGIRFFEYEWGKAASAGSICIESAERPYLHMLLYTPRLKHAAKRDVVAALTRAFVDAVGKPSWRPVIHICEHPYDNVGVNGELLADAYPVLGERPFYYATDDGSGTP